MKVRFKINILLLLSIFLVGCQLNSTVTPIPMNPLLLTEMPSEKTLERLTTRVDLALLTSLSTEENPFLLYMGNPTCSSCLQFQPILLAWIEDTKAMVYYFDTLQHLHQLSVFQTQFPNYFPEGFSTPTLLIMTGTDRIDRIATNQAFYNQQRFQALMLDVVMIQSVVN